MSGTLLLVHNAFRQVRKSLGRYSPMPGHTAWRVRGPAEFWSPQIPSPRPFCTVTKMYKPALDRPLREWLTESKEGGIVLIRSLTSIPVFQNLAAHSIFGCLRAAEILPIDPEARVVFLYQITVVPDYCNRREDRSHLTGGKIHNLHVFLFELSSELQTTAHSSATLKGSRQQGQLAHKPGPRELCSYLQWSAMMTIS